MSKPKGPRHLRADEAELWRKITEQTNPLRRTADPKTILNTKPKPKPADAPRAPIEPFKLGQNAPRTETWHETAPQISDRLAAQPVAMDKRAFGRMKRGKLKPEARIDLHGMTLAVAHPALTRFILASSAQGLRLVLVITGKGRRGQDDGPIPTKTGILKHQVPEWLRSAALSHAVLQITQAHARHGGSGAYYVYLRRGR
ncbi:MAG: Smr/MutS family protein [Alphaproteobacteria bacterium]|nr:Smr/MutS family protein [Alphaproteobacteria bacterium]NNF24197.1 DNA mismatch repair protein MutS [Paracoccaceae bacterium]